MNLIDRDALIEYMMPYLHNEDELQPADVIADIRVQPVIDAKPVVHGEWIAEFHEYANKYERCMIADEFHCSECGVYSRDKFNYCHNCGADMRGVKDE